MVPTIPREALTLCPYPSHYPSPHPLFPLPFLLLSSSSSSPPPPLLPLFLPNLSYSVHLSMRCVALRYVALRYVALRCVALRCVALRCVALRPYLLTGVSNRSSVRGMGGKGRERERGAEGGGEGGGEGEGRGRGEREGGEGGGRGRGRGRGRRRGRGRGRGQSGYTKRRFEEVPTDHPPVTLKYHRWATFTYARITTFLHKN